MRLEEIRRMQELAGVKVTESSSYQVSRTTSEVVLNFGEYDGEEAEVTFTYYPGESSSFDGPGCDEEFDIESVIVQGRDISSTMTAEDYDAVIALLERAKEDYVNDDFDEPDDYYDPDAY